MIHHDSGNPSPATLPYRGERGDGLIPPSFRNVAYADSAPPKKYPVGLELIPCEINSGTISRNSPEGGRDWLYRR